eukprot:6600351-Pyramimonas_sp.AAC.1
MSTWAVKTTSLMSPRCESFVISSSVTWHKFNRLRRSSRPVARPLRKVIGWFAVVLFCLCHYPSAMTTPTAQDELTSAPR